MSTLENKDIALSSTKVRSNEEDNSDSDMGTEEMALFVKKNQNSSTNDNKINLRQLKKLKKNVLKKQKFVRNFSEKSGKK